MAKYRHIHCEFWNDEKVELEMTPEDKYLMLYILTNDRTNSIGIYGITFKRIAYQTGYSVESVSNIVERLEKLNLIQYSKEHKEVCIINWGRWNLNKGGKPIEDAIIKDLKTVKNELFIEVLKSKIENQKLLKNCFGVEVENGCFDDTCTIRPRYGGKTETETETERETETEKETENKKGPAEPSVYESLLGFSFKIFSESNIEGVFFEKMKHLHGLNDLEVNDGFRKWKAKKEALGETFKTNKHLKASFNKFLEYEAKNLRGGQPVRENKEDYINAILEGANEIERRRYGS